MENLSKKSSNTRLIPDLREAQRHLKEIDSRSDAQFTFQTFLEDKSSEVERGSVTGILHGTLRQHYKELVRRNRSGAGIFVTVNETDGKGRKEENIVRIRAVFADKDDGALPPLPLAPSLIIESKRGDHPYWKVHAGTTLSEFRSVQKAIAHNLKSDKSICDPPRVMRLAGFFHMKEPSNPFLVKIKLVSEKTYTIEEVFAAFPQQLESENKKTKAVEAVSSDKFSEWALSLPIEEGAGNPLNGRDCTLLILIREGLGCDVERETLLVLARDYCNRSKLNPALASKMLDRQEIEHRKSPFTSYFVNCKEKYWPSEVADLYLLNRNLVDDQHFKLRYHKEDFYQYRGDHYAKIPRSELRADVMAFLQNSPVKVRATINFANNLVANIEGKTLVPETKQFGSFLSQGVNSAARLIPMKNGIFDIERFIAKKPPMLHHTPDFFSTNCLPFEFDPRAKCLTWRKFLKEMLPESDVQLFLQEWFGYNLVFDTSQHTFVLLIGEGANGKTVVCVVLRALLGRANISAVSLEQFNPVRTFPLSAMIGKLANIVEEIGEYERTAEGVLKDFVSGGVMTVEKKHRDAFETTAMARLTFASNILPRFRDRSSGLWRRMMPIPFRNQILDPKKQDKNLIRSEWWEQSGELPGIFNWAIEGLVRLREQGNFTQPAISIELRDEYRKEANPAATFLNDNCEKKSDQSISSLDLYANYARSMEKQSAKPLGNAQFTREVRKTFPEAKLSENALRIHGQRSRVWQGIGWRTEAEPEGGSVREEEIEDFL